MAKTQEQLVRLRRPIRSAEGFVELYRRESERVLTFCARRVLEAEAAVDLTAETFAQAYRGRRGFRGDTEVEARAWLLSIARRQISRYLRKGAMDRRATRRSASASRSLVRGRPRRSSVARACPPCAPRWRRSSRG